MTNDNRDKDKDNTNTLRLALLSLGLIGSAGLFIYTKSLPEPGDHGPLSAPVLQSEVGMDEAAEASAEKVLNRPYPRRNIAGSYLSARFAQRNHDWKTAGEYIDFVLGNSDDDATLAKRAMVLAMGAGEPRKAVKLARDVIEMGDEESALAHMFLATDAFKKKNYEEAATQIQKMPDGGLSDFIMPLLYSWSSAAMGTQDTAHLTGNSIHLYHAILIADFLNKTNNIEGLLEQTLSQHELMPEDVERIADIYVYLGEIDAAKTLYQQVLDIVPDSLRIADKLQKIEGGEKPDDIFARVQSPEQGVAEAMYDMARLLTQDYSDESARVFARMALYLTPDMTKAKLLLARIASRNERYDDAIEMFRSVQSDDIHFLAAHRNAADILHDQGQIEEALAELKTLHEQHGDIDALIQTGNIYRIEEDFDKAIEFYNRAEKEIGTITDEYWHLYYFRGMSYEQAKKWSKAEADLKAALSFRPDHPYVLNYLGYAWADQGVNLQASLDMIAKAVSLRPGDGYITDSLGWVYYRMGMYEDAVPYLEQAVELMPYDPVINDHLGDAYWKVGRVLEARFQWTRAKNHSEDGTLIEVIDKKLVSGLSDKAQKDEIKKGEVNTPPTTSQAAIETDQTSAQ